MKWFIGSDQKNAAIPSVGAGTACWFIKISQKLRAVGYAHEYNTETQTDKLRLTKFFRVLYTLAQT